MESLLFSFHTIAPIFLLVAVGFFLKKKNVVGDAFFSGCDVLSFRLCLPCLLFVDIATADLSQALNPPFIVFCVVQVTFFFLITPIVAAWFIKDKPSCGAFSQGSCRSNSAILGITLARNMFGELGVTTISGVLPFTVTLFNVYSVMILNVFAPTEAKQTKKEMVKQMGKSMATNPLIIAILLAVLWQLTGLSLPLFLDRSLSYLSDMTIPLSLLSLGASFSFKAKSAKLGLAVGASVLRTVVYPLIAILLGRAFGLAGVELGVVLILFGGPAAVSSYIMAKQMKSNHTLAANIVLLSTLMSVITLFIGIFLLRELTWI